MDQARLETVSFALDFSSDFRKGVVKPPFVDAFFWANPVDVLIQNAPGAIPYGWPEGNALYSGPRE
jgi:hypothetical protein